LRLAGAETPVRMIDPRILRVLVRLSTDIDLRLDAGQAAEIACLSESRFSHLFVAEVGLPFRTYLLWRRLMVAVNGVAAGSPLTNAAHDAGFADSAHFSRTFLRMFGVPASLLMMI
jgi:AraC-like DNA-binding protein